MTGLPDLRTDRNALRVRKRPIPVSVIFATAAGICDTLEGPVRYRAGDALLTGVQNEQWPVERHVFTSTYAPVPPTEAGQNGQYLKLPSETLAIRLNRPITVAVGQTGNPLRGHPGDWLLRYADGAHGIVRDEIFHESYAIVPDEA
jgi:hypothetical protein